MGKKQAVLDLEYLDGQTPSVLNLSTLWKVVLRVLRVLVENLPDDKGGA
ncbi:MAG: hypothetical protein HQL69_20480 [Magnetococcales bacterium]|nr:hypothetical protein [Magnetococcales bacterium]